MIDLRSDTITRPTEKMRRAMYEAEVGDDVYGEDPTVNRLEEKSAQITGKEAAMYVSSGTMGNQVAILTHTSPGTEVIMEADAHIYYYEAAAASVFAGIQPRPLPGSKGVLSPELVEKAIRPDDIHLPPTSLICLENTHNRGGGKIVPLENMKAIHELACRYRLPVHLDGARIFNASIGSGVPVKDYTACTTSVQFCFSKGLGAPVGSIVTGPADFIEEARRWRKRLGGGMRQAGVIAAACLVALDTMVERLADDHANARLLAEGLSGTSGLDFDPSEVETNIIIFKPIKLTPQQFNEELKKRNILASIMEPDMIRLTTSREVNHKDIEKVVAAVKEILSM